jgi:hypothetical protein
MIKLLLCALVALALVSPARADMYQDGSNAKLPADGAPASTVCQTAAGKLVGQPAGCNAANGTVIAAMVCDGSTDVTMALQAELNNFSAMGGGRYMMPVGKGCVVGGSTDLTIPHNVQIVCSQNGGGYWPIGDFATYADFLVNAAHTITTASSNQGGRSGVFGCNIVRQGYTTVTSLRTAIQAVAAFAGNALTCNGTQDVTFQDNLIIGFGHAITTNCQRLNVRRNRVDSLYGFYGLSCYDTCYINQNEVWPFTFAATPSMVQYQDSAISAITNSGGLFTIVLSAAPATPLDTGDKIVIHDAAGTPTANGRWTITVVDATHFTLQGSTFAGSYTGGGSAFLSSTTLRTGIAFFFSGGQFFGSQNVVFGWDRGVVFGDGNDGSICANCWIDSFQNSKDPVPVGILSTGTSANAQYSGYVGQPVTQINLQGTSGGEFLRLDDTYLVGFGATASVPVISVAHGALQMTGGSVVGTPGTAYFIYVADAANNVSLSNVSIGSGNIAFQTPATDCPKLRVDGVVGPCSFTPVIQGDGTPGAFTYTTQTGAYTAFKGGVNTVVNLSWSTITTPPTGTNTFITGPPGIAAGGEPGPCVLGYVAGMPVQAGYTSLHAGLSALGSNITLFEHGATTGVTQAYPPASLAPNSTVQIACHYFQ